MNQTVLTKTCANCNYYDMHSYMCCYKNRGRSPEQSCKDFEPAPELTGLTDFKSILKVDITTGKVEKREVEEVQSIDKDKALEICTLLIDGKMRQLDITKKLGISANSLHKHLQYAIRHNWIKKVAYGEYDWVAGDEKDRGIKKEHNLKDRVWKQETQIEELKKRIAELESKLSDKAEVANVQAVPDGLEERFAKLEEWCGQLHKEFELLAVQKVQEQNTADLYERFMKVVENLVGRQIA